MKWLIVLVATVVLYLILPSAIASAQTLVPTLPVVRFLYIGEVQLGILITFAAVLATLFSSNNEEAMSFLWVVACGLGLVFIGIFAHGGPLQSLASL